MLVQSLCTRLRRGLSERGSSHEEKREEKGRKGVRKIFLGGWHRSLDLVVSNYSNVRQGRSGEKQHVGVCSFGVLKTLNRRTAVFASEWI